MIKRIIQAIILMGSTSVMSQVLPYQDNSLQPHERAVDLTQRLTIEEKASLMCDESPAIPRLGI